MVRRASTFTTYLSVEEAKNVDKTFSDLERKANSAFGRISATAARASSVASGNAGSLGRGGAGVSTGALVGLAAAERGHAQALQRTASASRAAEAASGRLAAKHLLESNAARAASASTSQLERSLRLAAVAANVAQGPLGPIAGRLSAAATAVRELTGIRLGVVGAGAGIAAFARYASVAQDLKSQLRPLFETQQQVNAAFAESRRIAEDARVGLAPVIDLYSRLTLAGRDAGLSERRIRRVTEIATKAAKLSGGSATSQESGLYQFAQGIGSGTLAGDELKSVREGTLRLAKAIADGMGVPMAALKKLGKEGKLTPKVIADALEHESERIDKELSRLPITISSATAKLNNAFLAMVDGTDEAYGVTRVLSGGMVLLADNLGLVARAAIGVAVAYASIKTTNMVRDNLQRINTWQTERQAIIQSSKATAESASATRMAAAQKVAALRAERSALQSNLEAERALATQTRQRALALNKQFSGADYIGQPKDFAAYNNAVSAARIANDNFAASKTRLRSISGELRGAFANLTTSTGAYRTATNAAKTASLSFARAAKGLWAAINPLGIVLGIGINLLLQYALQEDAAAGAADRMSESQSRLAKFVDFTTGRIIEQNKALIANEALNLRKQVQTAKENYNAARNRVTLNAQPTYFNGRPIAGVGLPAGAQADIKQYQEGKIFAPTLSTRLEKYRGQGADVQIDRIIQDLGATATLAREVIQGQAQQRVLAGKGNQNDLRLAQGNFTGSDTIDPTGANVGGDEKDKKVAKGRKERADATDKAAKAERELQQVENRTDKRTDILSRYDEQSSSIDKAAKDARELAQLVGETMNGIAEATKENPLGKGIYTEEMAQADAARIREGVRRPLQELFDEQKRGIDISKLRLEGYDAEAAALERALSIQDNIGAISRADLETITANEIKQRQINDALASRERQVQQILDLAQQTRDSFEEMFVSLSKDPVKALKNFGQQAIDNVLRIRARQLSEKIFAGADEKLRGLVTGTNGVDRAADILSASVKKTAESTTPLIAANDNLAKATESAAARITAAANGIAAGTGLGSPTLAPTPAAEAAKTLSDSAGKIASTLGNSAIGKTVSVIGTVFAAGKAAVGGASGAVAYGPNGEVIDDNYTGDIPVVGRRPAGSIPANKNVASGSAAYGQVFEDLGKKLDTTFKSGTFFSGVGKGVGKALGGAATGTQVAGLMKAVGIKTSTTGAQIGGTIGKLSGIPGADIVGSIIGGLIGGALKKTKKGSSAVTVNQYGEAVAGTAVGNSTSYKKAATGLAGAVGDQLNSIADQLGGDLGSFGVSIGQRKKKYVVDPTGQNRTKGAGVVKFKDEQEAIQYALEDALKDGAITGISNASKKILASGQDLQRALNKALAIENIPKRLMQLTDPVRYAVTTLNDEFTKLISYLKEGGASAEQFADAQKLYDLERASAIEQATNASVAALQAYMDEMMGGASSPLNKKTVYENAAASLSGFKSDIAAGKAVDQNDFLAAVRNFQDASRALNGSSQQFFTDFNDLYALVGQAKTNVTGGTTSTGDLPTSPFQTAEVQALIKGQTQATTDQTAVLGDKLDNIVFLLQQGRYPSGFVASAIKALPGFAA